MKKSVELAAKIYDLKCEAEEYINNGDTKKAEEVMNHIREVKKEYEDTIVSERVEEEQLRENYIQNFCSDKKVGNSESMKIKDGTGKFIQIVNKGEQFSRVTKTTNDQGLELGKYLRGMVTGKWEGASAEKGEFKALNTSTGTTLIPRPLASQVIDLARNNMVLSDIPIIPMETNNLTIAKIIEDPQFAFKKELGEASLSSMMFAPIELKTKMIYGLMKISLELLNSAANVESILTNAMAQSMAHAIDMAGIYGAGSNGTNTFEPLGITKVPGINLLENIDKISTSKFTSFVNGIGNITSANGVPTHVAYNSDIETNLNLLTDTTGQLLNAPNVFNTLNKKVSNVVKPNESIVFDSNAIVMGLQKDIQIETSKELGFSDGSVYFRIYAMVDFAVLKPKHITHIKYNIV